MTGRNLESGANNPSPVADAHEDAYVWATPARQGGEPCVGGTRVPSSLIAALVLPCGNDDGCSIDEVARDYDLTRPQVICALWWEYGEVRLDRRTRRGRWLAAAHSYLARLGKADDPGEFV